MNLHKYEVDEQTAFDELVSADLKKAVPPLSLTASEGRRKALLSEAARLRSKRTRQEPWRRAYNQFRRSLGLIPQQDVTLTYFARSLTHTFDFNLRMIHVVG